MLLFRTGMPFAVGAAILTVVVLASGQTADWMVIVSGTPVALPRPAERIGGDLFLTLVPVARALGFSVEVAPDVNGLRVRRGAGAEATYDGGTGEIRFGPIVAAQLRNFKQITITEPIEEVLFPLSGLIPLLAVDVRQDQDQNILHIDPSGGSSTLPSASGLGLSEFDYSAGMTTVAGNTGQYATLHGDALAGGVPLNTNILLSGTGKSVGFRQGNMIANLSRHRTVTMGDQTAISGIDSLLASVRGIGYGAPLKAFEANVYAGRAAGQIRASLGGPGVAQYDSTILGAGLRKRDVKGELSFGATSFAGPERKGTAAGAGFVKTVARNQFRLQAVAGTFSGFSLRTILVKPLASEAAPDLAPLAVESASKTPVQGMATGLSFSDTFSPIKAISITAQIDRYGKNFLTAREESQFNAQSAKRLSMTVQPFSNLSLFGSVNRREYLAGNPAVARGFNYGASGALPGLRKLRLSYFTSVLDDAGTPAGRFQLSQYSATLLNVRQFFANASYSAIGFGKASTRNLNASLDKDLGPRGHVSVHDQLQPRSLNRYGAEWLLDLTARGRMRVGMDRLVDLQTKRGYYVPILGLTLKLPGGHRLQLTYSGERGTHMLSFVIGGRVVDRQEVRQDVDGRISVAAPARLVGRVYDDSDLNGVFDSGKDAPVSDVTVWLDENTSVQTDAIGMYRFDQVKPGAHSVRADLADVPADMVFADNAARKIAILPYRDNTQNFAVVHTGGVTGKVTYLDYSQNADKPVERPMQDARVIADDERDTYSDVQGNIMLGSLPPGVYHLRVDPETIPNGYAASPEQMEIRIRPGEIVRGVHFQLVMPPKPVIIKDLPKQQSRSVTSGVRTELN